MIYNLEINKINIPEPSLYKRQKNFQRGFFVVILCRVQTYHGWSLISKFHSEEEFPMQVILVINVKRKDNKDLSITIFTILSHYFLIFLYFCICFICYPILSQLCILLLLLLLFVYSFS
jgi:hypothetical protein